MTDEQKKKLSLLKLGTKASQETREKMSKARKDRKVKPHTEETKRKISQANIGKKQSDEFKQKMKNVMIGNNYSVCKKVIDTQTGVIFNKITEAALHCGLKSGTLAAMLHGRFRNKTSMIFYQE